MPYQLTPIDHLEIYALMDNVSDPFTKSHDGMRWNEFQYQYETRKQSDMCGAGLCRACTGLSLLMKIHVNNKIHTLLFDTGPDEGLVVENAQRMGIDLTEIEAIILSHGHFDHYGGTLSVLKAIGKQDLPLYFHPELFLPRAFGRKDLIKVSYNLTQEQIESAGGKVMMDTKPTSLFANAALLSGEVPRHTPYETGNPAECRLIDDKWVNTPDIIDERCLMFNLKDKGVCVITGCGHTGVINATQHAKELLGDEKIHFIMGGFHLAGPAYANRIAPTVADLEKINPDFIITGHCTGRDAQTALSNSFGDKHIPYGVGTVFKF